MDENTLKTLKQMKEEFVSNLSGGSITEINTVTLVALVQFPLTIALTEDSLLMLSGRRFRHERVQQTVMYMVFQHLSSTQR